MGLLLLHGGAGRWRRNYKGALRVIRDACRHGYRFIESGRVLDAVVEAVAYMEDSGLFNAGVGSVLNLAGYREMDAGVMDSLGNVGGVTLARYPRNPVRLAHIVARESDHVILAGAEADRLAKNRGLEPLPPPPTRITRMYKSLIKKYKSGELERFKSNLRIARDLGLLDTVGAVGVCDDGVLATATSTGGVWLKLPGRIGDSPIPGSGFYADERIAFSATGVGEAILRVQPGSRLSMLTEKGFKLGEAISTLSHYINRTVGAETMGFIALSLQEAHAFINTRHMMIAWCSGEETHAVLLEKPDGMNHVIYRIR